MQPDPYATVLVAVMNNLRDWSLAREQHWYRIPVSRIPRRGVNAPILAFYQTKVFGPEGMAINYYAPVTAWQTATRTELLPAEFDHPRANELYYRLTLQPLQPLPHSIASARWHRIAFIVTHWAQLERATDVRELLTGNLWEERWWKALRKIGRLAEDDDPACW